MGRQTWFLFRAWSSLWCWVRHAYPYQQFSLSVASPGRSCHIPHTRTNNLWRKLHLSNFKRSVNGFNFSFFFHVTLSQCFLTERCSSTTKLTTQATIRHFQGLWCMCDGNNALFKKITECENIEVPSSKEYINEILGLLWKQPTAVYTNASWARVD